MTDEILFNEIMGLLEANSPFNNEPNISNADEVSFRKGSIFLDKESYLIEDIFELDECISIKPCHLLFEKHIKIEVDYRKPIYILFDKKVKTPFEEPIILKRK